MFGDVGQGLILFLGGLFLYKKKHMDLAGIISCAGVFSTFFGFMYGSIFGFDILLESQRVFFGHPATQDIERIYFVSCSCAGCKLTDIKA